MRLAFALFALSLSFSALGGDPAEQFPPSTCLYAEAQDWHQIASLSATPPGKIAGEPGMDALFAGPLADAAAALRRIDPRDELRLDAWPERIRGAAVGIALDPDLDAGEVRIVLLASREEDARALALDLFELARRLIPSAPVAADPEEGALLPDGARLWATVRGATVQLTLGRGRSRPLEATENASLASAAAFQRARAIAGQGAVLFLYADLARVWQGGGAPEAGETLAARSFLTLSGLGGAECLALGTGAAGPGFRTRLFAGLPPNPAGGLLGEGALGAELLGALPAAVESVTALRLKPGALAEILPVATRAEGAGELQSSLAPALVAALPHLGADAALASLPPSLVGGPPLGGRSGLLLLVEATDKEKAEAAFAGAPAENGFRLEKPAGEIRGWRIHGVSPCRAWAGKILVLGLHPDAVEACLEAATGRTPGFASLSSSPAAPVLIGLRLGFEYALAPQLRFPDDRAMAGRGGFEARLLAIFPPERWPALDRVNRHLFPSSVQCLSLPEGLLFEEVAPFPFAAAFRQPPAGLLARRSVETLAAAVRLFGPAFEQARKAARRASCALRLRQIGLALELYRKQFGRAPASLAELYGGGKGVLPSAEVFRCPGAPVRVGRGFYSDYRLLPETGPDGRPSEFLLIDEPGNHEGGCNALDREGKVQFLEGKN